MRSGTTSNKESNRGMENSDLDNKKVSNERRDKEDMVKSETPEKGYRLYL